jgi:hypothetical protein
MQMEFWHKKVKVWAWIILPRLGRQIELESKAVIDRIHEIKILKKGKTTSTVCQSPKSFKLAIV